MELIVRGLNGMDKMGWVLSLLLLLFLLFRKPNEMSNIVDFRTVLDQSSTKLES